MENDGGSVIKRKREESMSLEEDHANEILNSQCNKAY